MKTKEFAQKVKELDLGVVVYDKDDFVEVSRDFETILQVCSKVRGRLNTDWDGFARLDDWHIQSKLLSLAINLAYTPIEEREESEKYYLRLPSSFSYMCSWLNYNHEEKRLHFSNRIQNDTFQTQFTQEEINQLPHQELIKMLIQEPVKVK